MNSKHVYISIQALLHIETTSFCRRKVRTTSKANNKCSRPTDTTKINAQLHQQNANAVSVTLRTYNTEDITSRGTVHKRPTMCSQEHKNKEEIKIEINQEEIIIQIINQIIRRIQQEEANVHVILIETESESDEDSEDNELPPFI